MKYLALILSLIMIGLNANSVDMLSSTGEEVDCCVISSTSCSDQSGAAFPLNQDERDCEGPCNPLITCCGQMGFIIPEFIPRWTIISPEKVLNGICFKPTTSFVIPSIWNPPKRG